VTRCELIAYLREPEIPDLDFTVFLIRWDMRREQRRRGWKRGEGNGMEEGRRDEGTEEEGHGSDWQNK
jgi:hypothetical protein